MRRIDEIIRDTIDGVPCCQGHVLPFGASVLSNGGINFSVNSADAEGCELQLYHSGDREPYANMDLSTAYYWAKYSCTATHN
jgi:glycogen operon protein